ncbi:MAG TPA: XdhC family protein [Candidatus Lachnoclostridium pullistercoris]|uniref:XdhC family protein n=1 Tax=Candidatus Lachnoclostridium pullistercoris TaxID=2838632 RepID=A0A9D2PDR0_9FIRM|nr:XdhC family protein [Candidatus Lachnoclostridium pullistercoris]
MKEIFQKIKECLDRGEDAVLVTVAASSGSTPREAGAHMAVTADGLAAGTIGGGAVEYESIKTAEEVLKTRRSRFREFTLTKNQAADIGMICGGTTSVYFQYISPENGPARRMLDRILKALDQDRDCWMILDLTDEAEWKMRLFPEESAEEEISDGVKRCLGRKAGLFREEGRLYYGELLAQAGTVYVFGGGHVAQELVPLLAHLEFRCVVMDDREEFSNASVFPQAAETITGDMGQIDRYMTVTGRDYVCIMTRGHQFDYLVLRQALKCRPRYIGVMGSRTKIRATKERLREDGFSEEEIESCRMPIGTAICAETPGEIAVSVAGELISVRAAERR